MERAGNCQQTPLARVGSAWSGWITLGLYLYFPGPHCSGFQVCRKHTDHTSHAPPWFWPLCSPGAPWRHRYQASHVSPQGSWAQAMTLLADANHPGTQKDMVSSQLGGRCGLWCWDCNGPLPSISSCCSPVSLPPGRGHKPQLACSSLVFAKVGSFVLWVLEPSCGESPLFFFVSLLFLKIGLLCHISSLRLSSGHSNMVLTLRTCHVAHLLCADASVWFASLLVIAVQHRFCGLFFCLFVFQLCCSLSFQSSLLIQIVRFPMVWKFLLLHGSLPRTGLHPWILCLSFCLLSFVLPPFKEIGLAFWVIWCPLPAFRSCSVKVAPHSDYLLMCLWGRKWSPHPTPLPSWDLAHAIILTWKIPWTQNPGGL